MALFGTFLHFCVHAVKKQVEKKIAKTGQKRDGIGASR